jgi:general secretion pathway protein D
MQRAAFILVAVSLAAALAMPAYAGTDQPADAPPIFCGSGIPGGVSCVVTKKELKEARNAYQRGLKLQGHHQLEEAFKEFDEAARTVPQDMKFLTARELVKGQLVFNHIQSGNSLLAANARTAAAAEFRAAVELDSDNQFARDRLAEATRPPTPLQRPAILPTRWDDAGEIHLQPKADKATFHYAGDVRGLFNLLASSYGVATQFDDSVQSRQVQFTIDNVDFFTALKMACQVSKTMWSPLGSHQVLIAQDSTENHHTFDHMSLGTFKLPPHSTPAEGTEFVTAMKVMFDLRFVAASQTSDTVEIRAPENILHACAQLLAQLDNQRPQVMLDIRVFEISHQFTRQIGLHLPNTFNLYNIPVAALAALGGQNIQQLINQLIASGGINQAGSTALSGLLAQLQGQGNSIFSQPLATFGGGLTFSGLSLDQLSAALSLNESWSRSLESLNMRAAQGSEATFHVGSRYPIMNASYAPIYNSPAISQVLGNQSYVPPFPSVSYEDIGLSVKVKPTVHASSVGLDLELQVRALTGQSNNGVPVISNEEYKGGINLNDGEPAVVAGQVSRTDMASMSGIPGLSTLPALNQVGTMNSKEEDSDELMIVITPHILSNTNRTTPEIWLSEK